MVGGVVGMKVKVKSSQSKPSPQPRRLVMPAQEGFITKFVRVILDDIRIKIAQLKYKFIAGNQENRQKWEDFERFCKLSRGEK